MDDIRVHEAYRWQELLVQGVEELLGALPYQVVDILGALLIDQGPSRLAYGVLQLVRDPLTPPTVKMNSAGSSIPNCRKKSTLAFTLLAVGACLMGALHRYSRVVLTM